MVLPSTLQRESHDIVHTSLEVEDGSILERRNSVRRPSLVSRCTSVYNKCRVTDEVVVRFCRSLREGNNKRTVGIGPSEGIFALYIGDEFDVVTGVYQIKMIHMVPIAVHRIEIAVTGFGEPIIVGNNLQLIVVNAKVKSHTCAKAVFCIYHQSGLRPRSERTCEFNNRQHNLFGSVTTLVLRINANVTQIDAFGTGLSNRDDANCALRSDLAILWNFVTCGQIELCTVDRDFCSIVSILGSIDDDRIHFNSLC